jgi:hypothetical protein
VHIANSLLAALPRTEYQRLLVGLEPVKLTFGQVLYEPGEPIRHTYFPNDCLVSLLAVVEGRTVLEVGLFLYTHAAMAQATQIAVCSRFHLLEARLARSLLMTCDRAQSNDFRLTHEFLARMLGVRRVGVTQAAGALQQRKLISYNRGDIRILDRKGLEAASCRCYQIVKNVQDRTQGEHSNRKNSTIAAMA